MDTPPSPAGEGLSIPLTYTCRRCLTSQIRTVERPRPKQVRERCGYCMDVGILVLGRQNAVRGVGVDG